MTVQQLTYWGLSNINAIHRTINHRLGDSENVVNERRFVSVLIVVILTIKSGGLLFNPFWVVLSEVCLSIIMQIRHLMLDVHINIVCCVTVVAYIASRRLFPTTKAKRFSPW